MRLVLLLPSALCLFVFSVPGCPCTSLSLLLLSLLSLLSVLRLSLAVLRHASSHLTLAPEFEEFLDNPEQVDVGLSEDAPDPERERERACLVMRIPLAVSVERRFTVSVCDGGRMRLPLLDEAELAFLLILGKRMVDGRPRPSPSMLFFFFPTSVPVWSSSTGRSHCEGEAVSAPASKEDEERRVMVDEATEGLGSKNNPTLRYI